MVDTQMSIEYTNVYRTVLFQYQYSLLMLTLVTIIINNVGGAGITVYV